MGIIEGYAGPTLAGNYPAGSAGKLVLYSKEVASALPALVTSGYQQIQNAGSAGKLPAFYQRLPAPKLKKGEIDMGNTCHEV